MTSERKIYVGLDEAQQQEVIPVGLLKLARREMIESGEFTYGRQYLVSPNPIALHPSVLPLSESSQALSEKRIRDGGALPLIFRDALPDSWGRKVLDAHYAKKLGDIDTLLISNHDRVGAMVFAESLNFLQNDIELPIVGLEDIAQAIRRLELAMDISPAMRRLLQYGGSIGGARPKATILNEGRRWLAKFPALGDDHDVELLERSSLELAQRCGIEVSPAKLEKIYQGHALMVSRFDRVGLIGQEQRLHYLSASALLDIPYESHGGSYLEFANVLRRISIDPQKDLDQLFRRLVLNLMIDNTDDHLKNHGVLHVRHGQYRLSPAFDVVMQLTNLGYQELAITPNNHHSKMRHAIEIAPLMGINEIKSKEIVEMITDLTLHEMTKIVKSFGGDRLLIDRVKKCLNRQQEIIFYG